MFMAIVSEKVQGEQILFQLQQNSKCPSVMFLILCLVPVGAGTNENGLPWNNREHVHILCLHAAPFWSRRDYIICSFDISVEQWCCVVSEEIITAPEMTWTSPFITLPALEVMEPALAAYIPMKQPPQKKTKGIAHILQEEKKHKFHNNKKRKFCAKWR